MKNGNKSAFPQHHYPVADKGLTKREYFAAMALQGLLGGGNSNFSINGKEKPVNEAAVILADALLAELGEK